MQKSNQNLYNKAIDSLRNNWILWLFFSLAALIVFVFRYPFIHATYGFDQAVYLYEGKALSLGEIPYKDVWDQRPLGMGYFFALLYKIGFNSLTQINIVEILFTVFSLGVFSYVAKKIINSNLAVGVGTVYLALLLVDYNFMGGSTEGYIEIHLIVPVLIIILATYMYGRKANLAWLVAIGLSTFVAFMIRITSIDFLAPVFIFLFFLSRERNGQKWLKPCFKNIIVVSSAFIIPLFAYLAYLGNHGVLTDFYNAIVKFNVYYGSQIPDLKLLNPGLYIKALYSVVNLLRHLPSYPMGYVVSILGIILLIKNYSKFNLFILLFFLFSLINIASGLKPWPHYLIMIYPFIAIFSCFMVKALYDDLQPFFTKYNFLKIPLLAIVLFSFVNPYQLKPFVNSLQQLQTDHIALGNILNQKLPDPIVTYANQHNWSGERAIYWTNWNNFAYYFETNMLSSTRYFSNPAADNWDMPNTFATPDRINEMLKDLKDKPPKIIVLDTKDFQLGSLVWSDSSPFRQYIKSHYKIEPTLSGGTVEVFVQK